MSCRGSTVWRHQNWRNMMNDHITSPAPSKSRAPKQKKQEAKRLRQKPIRLGSVAKLEGEGEASAKEQ